MLDSKRIEYLDFLKGIAAIMVVLTHSMFLFPQAIFAEKLYVGQMGCQLFFLVAGITSTMSYVKINDCVKFYKKRFFSLAPMVWFTIIVFLMSDCSWIPDKYTSFRWESSQEPLKLLINAIFLNGVFEKGNNDVIPGGWFIGCLAVIYILVPVLVRLVQIFNKGAKQIIMFIPLFTFLLGYIIDLNFTNVSINYFNNMFLTGYNSFIMQLSPVIYGIIIYQMLEEKKFCEFNCNKGLLLTLTLMMGTIALYNYYFKVITGNVFIWGTFFYFLFWTVYEYWNKIKGCAIVKMFCSIGRVSFTMLFAHFLVFMYVAPILNYVVAKSGLSINPNVGWILFMVILLPIIYICSVIYAKLVGVFTKALKMCMGISGN